mmetsp:Transcript_33754/g.64283  ORF Transcript_33754/g.64283 Transcript_33754/m.64283 type:complete len:337 (-) Transcript_33754:376-1386(-)
MSKAFAESFFPHVTHFLSSHEKAPSFLVTIWESLFPQQISTLCGLHHVSNESSHRYMYIPRRPCLSAACIIGAYIGMTRGSASRKRGGIIDHRNNALARGIFDNWSRAAWKFGWMNVVALLHHCIIPSLPSLSKGYIDNLTWALDCIFTGASSINIIIAALLIGITMFEDRPEFDAIYANTPLDDNIVCVLREGIYFAFLPITIAMMFLLLAWKNGIRVAISESIELFYLVPLSIAAAFLFPLISKNRNVAGARIAVFGGAIVVASLPLDARLCTVVSEYAPSIKSSPLFYDSYHLPTLVFVGCDIAFLGLDAWVMGMVNQLHITHYRRGGSGKRE